ncbi:Prophage Clp protease-like protein [Vibrio chagasii]|nr:Prophage Clp protease-like protein [Vibrio chagasii]
MANKTTTPTAKTTNKWFDFVASADTNAPVKLYLYGDIGWYDIAAADMVAALAPYVERDIDLHILSDGGSVWEGFAIYSALKDHKGKITGIIDGVCASISSLIAMACDELLIRPFAQFMIHEAQIGSDYKQASEYRELADALDQMNDSMAEAFAAKTGKTTEEVRADMQSDFWLRGQEAVDYGLCDGLYDPETTEPSARHEMQASVGGLPPLNNLEALNAPAEVVAMFGKAQQSSTPTITKTNDPEIDSEPKAKGTDMTEEEKAQLRKEAIAQGKKDELQRRNGIGASFRAHLAVAGVTDLLNSCLDDGECTIAQANSKLIAHLGAQTSVETTPNPTEQTTTAKAQAKKYLAQALHSQMGAKVEFDKENPYRYMGTAEAIRASMKDMGRGDEIAGMTKNEMIAQAFNNTTSDLSDLLVEGVKLIIRDETSTLKPWHLGFVKRIPLDFGRPNARIKTTDKDSLAIHTENGEFRKVKLDGSREAMWLDSYGIEISITRELMQADNLGLIQSEIADFVAIAQQFPQELLLGMLIENVEMSDGDKIFTEKHKNLYKGALDAEKLTQISGDMVDTKSDKNRPLNLIPQAVLTSGSEKARVNAMLKTPMIENVPNLAYESFAECIGDGMLAGTGKAIFFANNRHTSIIEGYNKDCDGIQVETLQQWRSDGMTVRIWTDTAMDVVSRKGLKCNDVKAS